MNAEEAKSLLKDRGISIMNMPDGIRRSEQILHFRSLWTHYYAPLFCSALVSMSVTLGTGYHVLHTNHSKSHLLPAERLIYSDVPLFIIIRK